MVFSTKTCKNNIEIFGGPFTKRSRQMGYINDLPNAIDKSFVDGLINKSDETMIYINICGPFKSELEEAFNSIYFFKPLFYFSFFF